MYEQVDPLNAFFLSFLLFLIQLRTKVYCQTDTIEKYNNSLAHISKSNDSTKANAFIKKAALVEKQTKLKY